MRSKINPNAGPPGPERCPPSSRALTVDQHRRPPCPAASHRAPLPAVRLCALCRVSCRSSPLATSRQPSPTSKVCSWVWPRWSGSVARPGSPCWSMSRGGPMPCSGHTRNGAAGRDGVDAGGADGRSHSVRTAAASDRVAVGARRGQGSPAPVVARRLAAADVDRRRGAARRPRLPAPARPQRRRGVGAGRRGARRRRPSGNVSRRTGAGSRVPARRRLARLREYVGDPPPGAPADGWPG